MDVSVAACVKIQQITQMFIMDDGVCVKGIGDFERVEPNINGIGDFERVEPNINAFLVLFKNRQHTGFTMCILGQIQVFVTS